MKLTALGALAAVTALSLVTGCAASIGGASSTPSAVRAGGNDIHRILLTDDDGWNAAGIRQMYRTLTTAGYDVTLVGPKVNHSGASMSAQGGDLKTHHSSANPDFWWVDGTPVDAVRVALTGILSRKPDLVISGANDGANAAYNVNYSGTIGAATEASQEGVPAIAVSADVDAQGEADFSAAASRTTRIVKSLTAGALSQMRHGVLVNVNVPVPGATGRFRVATQGRVSWNTVRYTKSSGNTWTPGYSSSGQGGVDSDKKWLAQGRTTLTVLTASRDNRHIPSANVTGVLRTLAGR